MITHKNISSTVESGRVSSGANFTEDDVYISYLPLAHILALVVETMMFTLGGSVGYGNPRSLVDSEVKNCKGDLRELRPTLMAGVPSVYDKVKKGVMDKINHGSPLMQKLFKFAFEKKKSAIHNGFDTPFLNKLIFDKVKDQVGGRVRVLLSGGAPLSKETHDFLRVAICPTTIQGYGLTETTGGSTLMFHQDVTTTMRGGPPLSVAEIKLVDVKELNYTVKDKPFPRGEIWVRGANVSKGYYKLDDQTKEAYMPGGWFATGDIGQFDERGLLQIVDRKKNIVKLSHGEYIAVEYLESIYKNSPYVENVCIVARPTEAYCVAVVLPSKKNLARMANKDSVDQEFLHLKSTRDQVHSSITDVCKKAKLKTVEMPKFVYVVDDEWTPENLMLTAAMKIKRSEIEKKYAKEIDAMYSTGHE
jgi:long-chain acyl-CoA synthetase